MRLTTEAGCQLLRGEIHIGISAPTLQIDQTDVVLGAGRGDRIGQGGGCGDVDNYFCCVSYQTNGRNATRAKSLFGIEGIETTWNNETRWFCEPTGHPE